MLIEDKNCLIVHRRAGKIKILKLELYPMKQTYYTDWSKYTEYKVLLQDAKKLTKIVH